MATEEELPEAAAAPAPAGGGGGDDAEMPDAAVPSGSHSDSSDSDSDDEAATAAAELRIQALEKTLQEQPLDYETHVQYIQCLRKAGNIEKLRVAREEMNKYFPLTPKMWQEWAKDEISLSSSEESFGDIEKIYGHGVQEYLSIKLWRDYLDYVEEHDHSVSQCTPSGLSKMRNLFESAITAGGLHVTEGSKLWAAYREYEMAILITIADANDEEREKQVQRIRMLFHRQLSVPLADMESTLAEYKSWEAEQGNANDPGADFDGVPSNVVSAYKKANDMYNERKQYEDQLSNAGTFEGDKLQQFMKYIKFEEASGDPARVQVLYERAVSELPVSSDIWMGYTSYLDRTLKVPSVVRSVYYRATRNCTWVGELWVHYLLSLERIRASEEELQHVFERAIQCTFSTIQEFNIYLTRVHGLRRRISDGLDFQLIRQTLTDAAEFLSSQLSTKELLRLYAYWAKLELSLGKDLSAARGVWENAIKKSGSVFEVWEQYILMEIKMDHVHEARSLYKRCYSKRFAGSGSE
ncbi:EMBRYO DEFECTIVE 140 [Zea mays]|uniref:EMBRYO DEFECTIVE 140 n=1 Tax=Zea mays TaxID=4577 RepID=A0A1D6LE91_MAIZE|nr:EMBRYO DEFECTIVE 140 [Zea mays]